MDGFNERVHAYIPAKYYHYLKEYFGERGKRAFLHAVQYYGAQRGRRMAQRAIRDGVELTQENYNYYGEWINTEEIKREGIENRAELTSDGVMKISSCPWYTQFQDMNSREAGALYCKDLDASISRGFNPFLGYEVEKTLHEGEYCIHRLRSGNIGEGAKRGKNPESLRPFAYHCAHIFYAFKEVTEAIFLREGVKVSEKVLEDFQKDYGEEMTDAIVKYRNVNFNVCD